MKEKQTVSNTTSNKEFSFFSKYKWAFIPMLFAFALYYNTLHHGFVLDDGLVTQDKFVSGGIKNISDLFTQKTLPEAQRTLTEEHILNRYDKLSVVIESVLFFFQHYCIAML